LLGSFAFTWAAAVPEARLRAAEAIAAHFPPTGWLARVLDVAETFVDDRALLSEWPH
jgi:hypothetical protein